MPSNFARYPSLDGTPVVISGGASGIGETIVREFAAQGSKVGFVDIAGERGEALEAELLAAGQTAFLDQPTGQLSPRRRAPGVVDKA